MPGGGPRTPLLWDASPTGVPGWAACRQRQRAISPSRRDTVWFLPPRPNPSSGNHRHLVISDACSGSFPWNREKILKSDVRSAWAHESGVRASCPALAHVGPVSYPSPRRAPKAECRTRRGATFPGTESYRQSRYPPTPAEVGRVTTRSRYSEAILRAEGGWCS